MLRSSVLCAALVAALSCARPSLAVEYTYDRSYQFPNQTNANSGRGIAANSADTRLYAISRGTTSTIHVLDTASGAALGAITPSGAAIHDVVVSGDGSRVYIAKGSTASDARIEWAPADGGTAAELIPSLSSVPVALAVTNVNNEELLGIATRAGFQLWKNAAGTWTKVAEQAIFPDATRRDIAVAGSRFYVLTPTAFVSFAMSVYDLSGAPVSLFWEEIPDTVGNGYTLQSLTAATIDGTPSLFIAGDTVDDSFSESRLTVFRYTTDGQYAGDGFGFDLSLAANPLSGLVPMATTETFVPMTAAASHLYVGAVLPTGDLAGKPQFVRVTATSGTVTPARVTGKVMLDQPPTPKAQAGARVYLDGRPGPAVTDDQGAYTLPDIPPGPEHIVGAYSLGYAARSRVLSLTSGQEANVDFLLAELVPVFKLVAATTAPTLDGVLSPGEYPGSPMSMSVMDAGVRMDGSVTTVGYAAYDENNLYVAIRAREPNLAFNAATAVIDDQPAILGDDSAQIYIDPPHRHDIPTSAPHLYQFAVNVPPQGGTSHRLERRIASDGSMLDDLPSASWTSTLQYNAEGWVLEARIPLATLGIATPFVPDSTTEWGMLLARRRPQSSAGSPGHVDLLPENYSTSCSQVGALTNPKTWMDITFTDPVVAPLPGDVNNNLVVDVQDAAFVLRVQAGLTYSETGSCADLGLNLALRTGDVYPKGAPDGTLTMLDAVRLLRAINGLDTLP